MRKLFLLAFSLVLFASCTFVEEIEIQPDGSGKYNLDMDGSGLMSMIPKDSLKNEKNIDTIFSMKKIIAEQKDSISKLSTIEQEKIKKMENFNMRMRMNYETKQFLFSMHSDFKKVNELQDAFANLNSIQGMNKKKDKNNPLGEAPGGSFANNNSVLTFSYDGKKFVRKVVVNKKEVKKVENDSVDPYTMIYDASKYVLKYHFPKKVKKITVPSALFSEDRKTITIEYPFKEYMDHPEQFGFEVEFENK